MGQNHMLYDAIGLAFMGVALAVAWYVGWVQGRIYEQRIWLRWIKKKKEGMP